MPPIVGPHGVPEGSPPALALEVAEDAAARYAHGCRAAATWRAYDSDWRIFAAWCRRKFNLE